MEVASKLPRWKLPLHIVTHQLCHAQLPHCPATYIYHRYMYIHTYKYRHNFHSQWLSLQGVCRVSEFYPSQVYSRAAEQSILTAHGSYSKQWKCHSATSTIAVEPSLWVGQKEMFQNQERNSVSPTTAHTSLN